MPGNRVAFFIGAGASAAMGLPVTREILPKIVAKARRGSLFANGSDARFNPQDAKHLTDFVQRLLPGIRGARLGPACSKAVSIIDLLSLIDQLLLVSGAAIPQVSHSELRDYRQMLECAIFEVVRGPAGRRPGALQIRERFIERMGELSDSSCITLISTNYDTLVEQAIFDEIHLQHGGITEGGLKIAPLVDFGMRWRDVLSGEVHVPPRNPLYRIYKLHGSMNWLRCALCEMVYVNPKNTIQHRAFQRRITDFNKCHCDHGGLEAMMVTPSLVRDVRDGSLLGIWACALEALRTTDEWIFVGYSLPQEDIAIRTMLLRALHGRDTTGDQQRIRIVQRSRDAKPTYEALFGPGIRYYSAGLDRWLGMNRN